MHALNRARFFGSLFVLALSSALPLACSNGPARPKTVPVTGKVTYKGQAVAGAHVAFLGMGENATSSMGKTDAQGMFELTTFDAGDGAPVGNYQVTVSKIVNSQKAAASKAPMSMEEAVKRANPEGPSKEDDGAGSSLLPEKYAQASTSQLNFTVEEGKKNDFPIELTD